ncbi:hypothetical protein [Rhodovulum sulfidophilum]|uniref:hypothetical protein n=1 Tax=Rhodovulum sulfidophilum TaxID=35806 RepID=UPI001911FA48|nr:hypothetical protein [Rhodovulum sulfidophilum]
MNARCDLGFGRDLCLADTGKGNIVADGEVRLVGVLAFSRRPERPTLAAQDIQAELDTGRT